MCSNERLSDGNKESAKELLATFRSLFTLCVSGIFLLVSLNAKGSIIVCNLPLYRTGLSLGIISIIAMIFLFFLVIPKLSSCDEDIIYLSDVRITSLVAFSTFFLSYVLLIYTFSCNF